MKGLILNGSPRRDGKIGRLMKYAAEVSGEDVEVVNVYDLNIRPCTACMKCRITGIVFCRKTTVIGWHAGLRRRSGLWWDRLRTGEI